MNSSFPRPPWSGLGKRLESTLRKALYDFEMLDGVKDLAVALSGGKDSLTLLFLLKAVSGKGFPPFNLHAIHVDGAFSCGAGLGVDYLKNLCEAMGVNYIRKESFRKLEELECYSCSRERRSLLFEGAKEAGATTIAFGHTLDDNAETTMMNLLHKGEFAGMLPKLMMVEYGVTIVRPLIYVDERSIVEFAKQQGFLRAMCRCPVGQKSKRREMDQWIAELTEKYPNAKENIARASLIYGSKKAEQP
jgi:tRNA 2-thiocytidine biosynthesis protein TtcA